MSRTNIILTGFMGCGKTTVGKMIARRLGYAFIDTDQLIEKRCGLSVRQIFAARGEDFFRSRETEVAKALGEKEGLVIATGGGMLLKPENLQALEKNGRVFCLVATPEEILKRISGNQRGQRPLLDSPDPLQTIIRLIEERIDVYRQFEQLDTTGKTPGEIVERLLATL